MNVVIAEQIQKYMSRMFAKARCMKNAIAKLADTKNRLEMTAITIIVNIKKSLKALLFFAHFTP